MHDVDTTVPLEVHWPSTDLRAKVTITGKDLHENDGSEYWPDTTKATPAVMPRTKKIVQVAVTGHRIDDEGEDLLESLDLQPGETPMGFQNLHKESHYEEVPIPFCSNKLFECGLVDLGRYGPLLKEGE